MRILLGARKLEALEDRLACNVVIVGGGVGRVNIGVVLSSGGKCSGYVDRVGAIG